MKKSKVLAAALAATMFATAACGLVACGDVVDASGKTYTVMFDANGGALSGTNSTLKTDKNGYVEGTIPAAAPADQVNYTFNGWSLVQGDKTTIDFMSQTFAKNTTVYAVYVSKNAAEITVTFNYGDGSGAPASAQTTGGKLASLPTPTAPSGKKFDGWFTAATDGTQVTTDTAFDGENTTIYAQYSDNNDYCVVGDVKYYLEETDLTGADRAFFACVDLNEGDTVSFYIDGEIIEAWTASTWNGLAEEAEKTSVFTAARTGTFEFNLGYYPADATSGDPATWSLAGNDGVIAFHAFQYYLVGEEFGNWKKCLEDYYVGEDGLQLTVGDTPVVFKLAKCGNEYTGAIEWNGNLGADDVAVKGMGYISDAEDGNVKLATKGTYTIKLVDGQIEITSENVKEPEVTVFARHYYIVGEGVDGINWDKCVEEGYIGKTSGQIELTVGTKPIVFKIVKCKNVSGGIDWDSALGSGAVTVGRGYVSTDKDGNFVLTLEATYTIKLVSGKIEITSDVEEPELTKDIAGYTYGAVDSSKYYLVGGFIGEEFDGTNGYEMKTKNNGEYMVQGFYVEADGAVKIVIGDEEYGYDNIHEQFGNKNLATADDDGNIVFKEAGTYYIYINPNTKAIYLNNKLTD